MTLSFLLVGTPRSGTTVTQRICCELPAVAMPPETHFLQLFVPDLLRRRRPPLTRDQVAAELRRFEALPTSAGLRLDHRRVLDLVGPRCGSVYQLFAAVVAGLCPPRPPGTRFGEKTPEHLLWWRSVTAADPALRIIGVVRDPRAVAASHRAVPWGIGDVAELAEEWAFDQRQLRAAHRRLGPGRCLLLRYEDLVADPDRARARIAALLDVPDAATGSGAPTAAPAPPADTAFVHSWEWWKSGALAPVSTGRVAAWRDVLSDEECRTVAAVAGREMAAFGYRSPVDQPGDVDARTGQRRREARSRLADRLARVRRWQALAEM